METIITSIADEFPWLRKPKRKIVFTLLLCILLFLIGLPQCAAVSENEVLIMNQNSLVVLQTLFFLIFSMNIYQQKTNMICDSYITLYMLLKRMYHKKLN